MATSFQQQRTLSKRYERHEQILLILVSIFLLAWAAYAGIHKSPEAMRYDYDIHARFGSPEKQPSYSPKGRLTSRGTVAAGQLSELCGSTWYADFYAIANRNQRMTLLETCQLDAQGQAKALQQAQGNIVRLQQHIAAKLNYFSQIEKTRKIKQGNVDFGQPAPEKDYFYTSLSLSEKGRAAPLDNLQKYMAALQPHEADPAYKAQILAALAATEGDTAFPYRAVFANDGTAASEHNQTATFVRKITRINSEWATKAAKTKKIINPYKGMVTFLLMAWVAYLLLLISRRQEKPLTLLGIALVAWSLFGLFVSARFSSINPKIMYAMLAAGAVIPLLMTQNFLKHTSTIRSTTATRLGYPLFVFFLGLGLLILMDLSARGHTENRFIVYNHFEALFWAFVFVSVASTISFVLGKLISKLFAGFMLIYFWPDNFRQRAGALLVVALLLAGLGVVIVFGSTNNTVELLRLWMIFGMAAFLSVSRFRIGGQLLLSAKSIIMMLVVLLIPFLGMLLVGEMGSMMVIAYAAIVFLGGAANYASGNHSRKNNWVSFGLSVCGILLLTVIIFTLAPWINERAADRIESWHNAYEAINDQMAIIHWFKESAPFLGYPLGSIPWCGYNDIRCYVPKQMQSDYTATSLIVLFGIKPALILMTTYIIWLLHFIKGHMQANIGTIGLSRHQTLAQVFLVWSGIAWVVITIVQLLVTLAGNLGAIPLTGIPMTFISYGKSTLLVSCFFIGLLINRPFIDSNKPTQLKHEGHDEKSKI